MTKLVALYMWSAGLFQIGLFCITAIFFSLFLPAETYDPWLKRMLRNLFRLIFVPVRVRGAGRIAADKPYLYMANHVSLFDMPLLGGYIPGMVRSVEATRQFAWPLYGLAVRRLGNVPISRENVFEAMKSLKRAGKRLDQNHSLVIMPEGHRTLDGGLRDFKRLPFHFAKQAGVDLVPVGMSGLFTLKSKNSWIIKPTKIKLRFGNIVSKEQIGRLSVSELQELMKRRIERLVEYP